jgi:prostaglandin-endoperoxide synthase 2
LGLDKHQERRMGSEIEDIGLSLLSEIVGSKGWLNEEANELLINKMASGGRNRPHPWSTRYDYICWSGLTDRTYSARLLPASPYPPTDAVGTKRPPLADVVSLFVPADSGQRPCPKSTCLFPAFAQYLTDGFIRTQVSNDPAKEDRRRTTTNHEIDQSPLYGRTEAQTAVLRLKSEMPGQKGRLKTQPIHGEDFPPFLYAADGTLKPEFAILDEPLGIRDKDGGFQPWVKPQTLFAVGGDRVNSTPQVAMMNTLFLREHNRLAGLLESAKPAWDDERVFQTARNILIVMFIKIVIEEYINHINTSVFKFRALPDAAWHAKWNRPNWMTAEFSLLYRWHSLVPETLIWDGVPVHGMDQLADNSLLLQLGLAGAFVNVSANNATELGMGNTATFLQRFEGMAIQQARTNNIASFNDYREVMGKDRATRFEDIAGSSNNPKENARRKAIAVKLEALYGSVDNVEFYVGLFAEPRERNGPLPSLLLAMVAMDAFSQALTNPLLSEHVWGNKQNRRLAFTDLGLAAIEQTRTLADILARNSQGLAGRFVGMTRKDFKRE